MDVELAAVEDDVERKRVGRNPFDEKFTSLVRIAHGAKGSLDVSRSLGGPDSKSRARA